MAVATNIQKVIIMSGASGSGKTTLIRQTFPRAQRCSADDHFMTEGGEYVFKPAELQEAHAACLRKFVALVSAGEAMVLVDNTNTSWVQVAPYVALASAFAPSGVSISMMLVDATGVDSSALSARCAHGVPESTVRKQLADLLTMWSNPTPPEIARVAKITKIRCDLAVF